MDVDMAPPSATPPQQQEASTQVEPGTKDSLTGDWWSSLSPLHRFVATVALKYLGDLL